MAEEKHCNECGGKLSADTPQGLCPQCLMKLGLPTGSQPRQSHNNRPQGARETLAPPPETELGLIGHRIGNYRIKGIIAVGGMGCVYEAIQDQPQRTVALKVMKQGLVSHSALRRFEYETQILAHLQHPNIAQIYEAGMHRDPSIHAGGTGVPYFAMEYIPNAKTIIEYAGSKRLDTRERLDLFAQICDAVHYGHQKGVIHRDLKPGNILIDSTGQPKIIDFGVARATNADIAVTTLQTDVGKLIGTLQYMSPEQCEADPHDLDTRSDVYALGVILYELLCGCLPYDVSDAAVHEAIRVICEETPVKPSTINKRLKGDIETITLKAQEKDKARRYQSAADLAEDIRRHLNNEPIRARRISRAALIQRWRRRNPVVAALLAATAMLLFSVAIVAIVGYLAAARERDGANRNLYVAHMRLAHRAWESVDLRRVQELLARYRYGDGRRDFRGWEWFYLNGLCHRELITLPQAAHIVRWSPDGRRLATGTTQQEGRPPFNNAIRIWDADTGRQLFILLGHTKTVESITWSSDGSRLATITPDGQTRTIKIWNPTTGQEIHSLSLSGSINLSPDVQLLALKTQDQTGPIVEIWNIRTGEKIQGLRGHKHSPFSVAWDNEGRRIATAAEDGVKVWDAASGDEILSLPGTPFAGVAFSPDGKHLALVSIKKTTIWDATTGKVLKTLNTTKESKGMSNTSVYWSPDSRRLAYLDAFQIHVWDITSEHFFTLNGHSAWVESLAWSPDSLRLVSGGQDNTVRIWNTATAEQVRTLRGHTDQIFSVDWCPDGRRIASAPAHGGVKIWDAAGGLEATTLPGTTSIAGAWSPDGRHIASAGRENGEVAIWDPATGSAVVTFDGVIGKLKSVAWSPSGKRLATLSTRYDRSKSRTIAHVSIWDIKTRERVSTLPEFADCPVSVAWRQNGRHIVSLTSSPVVIPSDWTVQQWDAATGLETQKLEIKAASVAVSPDARRVAAVQWAGERNRRGRRPVTVTIWDLGTIKKTFTMRWREESDAFNETWVAWSPDGSRLASAGAIWDTATGKRVSTLNKYKGFWLPAGFWSPDGRLLAFRGKIWDTETGKLLRTLSGSSTTLAWSPDGRRLASSNGDPPDNKTAKIYDLVTGEEVLTLAGHSGTVISVAWSPDGKRLATAGTHGKLKVWDASTGYELAQYDPSNMWWGNLPWGVGDRFVAWAKRSSKDYSKILRQNPDDKQLWQRLALVQLGAGNEKGYRGACAKMLNRFARTRDPISADLVAWTCVLAPEAVADVNHPIKLAEQAVASDSASPAYLTTLGAALYRAGRFNDAARPLKEAIENDNFAGTSAAWLFLAMTEHRLGNKEQASLLLDKAVDWMDRLTSQKSKGSTSGTTLWWDKQLELEILRYEAKSQIESEEPGKNVR